LTLARVIGTIIQRILN